MPVASLFSLLLAVSAPPIVTAPVAPVIQTVGFVPGGGPRSTERFMVQVRQDDHLLWSGELTRASDGNANFSQQMRESRACTEGESSNGRGTVSQNSSLSVSINPSYPIGDGLARISVERTRPYGDAQTGCDGEAGTSTVRFETRAQLPAGKAVTLKGEGGLSVTVTRR